MLKQGVQVVLSRGLVYRLDGENRVVRCKPWLGDAFSFLYDMIMKRSIFPKKFEADMETHEDILRRELEGVKGKRVLELATGSGSAARFLDSSNTYTGTDISPGLLRRAVRNFRAAGFDKAEFHVSGADDLPFADRRFDLGLCMLSMNFFSDVGAVLSEMRRVLVPEALLLCSVPVPERNRCGSTIRGTLHTEEAWRGLCRDSGFRFEAVPVENGALLYFRAVSESRPESP